MDEWPTACAEKLVTYSIYGNFGKISQHHIADLLQYGSMHHLNYTPAHCWDNLTCFRMIDWASVWHSNWKMHSGLLLFHIFHMHLSMTMKRPYVAPGKSSSTKIWCWTPDCCILAAILANHHGTRWVGNRKSWHWPSLRNRAVRVRHLPESFDWFSQFNFLTLISVLFHLVRSRSFQIID